MEDVAIVGVGQSQFSRNCGMRVQELCFEAFREAMENIQLTSEEIDASIICSSQYDKQRSPAATISDYLGFALKPTFLIENACAAGSTGVRVAWSLIKACLHDIIAVIGVEKMSGQNSHEVADLMGRLYDLTWEGPFGLTMPAGYALYARAYIDRYGLTEEQLARIRVKSSHYGALNPKAAYRKELSLETILDSEPVAEPLKKFDCCANADGSSCVILARGDLARKICDNPIWIAGIGAASDTQMAGRKSMTSLSAAKTAAQRAYAMSGIKPSNIDVIEVHDCFTIAELMAYEDLGLVPPGQGMMLIDERETYVGGKIPVNVDGGLLSKGHPVAATGGSQIRTIVLQLQGASGEVQVKNAEIGVVHNVGGIGHYCNVFVLRN